MGNKWVVECWGEFIVGQPMLWNRVYGGEHLIPALWNFLWWRRKWKRSVRLSNFKAPPTASGEPK